jgi:hypothetical protein
LGYSTDNVQVYRNAAFGEWGGKIWLDEVECQGSEVRLEYCPYYGMAHNCHHNEEVGVACREFGAVSSSSSTFPVGVVVGVSVSVGFVAIVMVITIFTCLYRHRRRNSRTALPRLTYGGGPQPQIQIMQSYGIPQQIQIHPAGTLEAHSSPQAQIVPR